MMCKIPQLHLPLWSLTMGVLLTSQMVLGSTSGKRKLNDFIMHYEGLTYDTTQMHNEHVRAKRSLETSPRVYLDFRTPEKQFHMRLKRDASVFASNAQLEASGKIIPLDASHIYEGELEGEPGSFVHGSLINGIFSGTIYTPTETYHVEKSEVFFSDPQKFHSVIYTDRDVVDTPLRKRRAAESATCGNGQSSIRQWMDQVRNSAVEPRDKRSAESIAEENWAHKYSKQSQNYYNSRHKRSTETRPKRTCTLYLEADPMLWQYMTGSGEKQLGYDHERALEEITSLFSTHVSGIKNIYKDTKFSYDDTIGPYSGFSFVVRRVKINTDEDCEGQNYQTNQYCKPNIDVSNFLNLNSLKNHDLYCLAYVFTFRDFTGGTLGLAWVGSSSKASGGICEQYKEYQENNRRVFKSLNTGIVTLVNYGSRVPPKVSTLTFAHEVGHNFGSPHDGGNCVPTNISPNDEDGNYIMFASATSGDRSNNRKFSRCSIGNMTFVLDAVIQSNNGKKSCFVESEEAFCGNAIVETDEICDCGFETNCEKTDQCCYPQEHANKCQLKPNKECSPSQGPCCATGCTKVPSGQKICRKASECSNSSTCDGTSAVCPHSTPFADHTPCNDFTQVCVDGVCQGSICERINWHQCYMSGEDGDQKVDKGKMCFVACQNPNSQQCISTGDDEALEKTENGDLKDLLRSFGKNDIRLQPGAPCDNFKGYCDVFQKCRGVDADGPLARLKNLLLNEETLNTIKDWIIEYWWGVLLMGVGLVVFMGIFIHVCAVHTPSSNPKKAPARKISLKPQPRYRQQGPPPGYPVGHSRAGPSHGKGRGPSSGAGPSAQPPPYNPHSQMYEMRERPVV